MQHKITTHKGDILLLIEVPLDAYDFKYDCENVIFYKSKSLFEEKGCNGGSYDLPKSEFIGTTSTLTDKDVEPFIEPPKENIVIGKKYTYKDYHPHDAWYKDTALGSWNSLLQANNIDTNKNYVILKLLNNE
jgi:hypothetical protein